eukprot:6201125-Pleurochrysis_carterae.AAC.1
MSGSDALKAACPSEDPKQAMYYDCRSWCNARYAGQQCGHCNCRACLWCAPSPSPVPSRPREDSLLGAVDASPLLAGCSSTDPKHALFPDCRPWCQQRFASEQRGHCNCRKCAWYSLPPYAPPADRDEVLHHPEMPLPSQSGGYLKSQEAAKSTAAAEAGTEAALLSAVTTDASCPAADPKHSLFRDCRAWCQSRYASEQCGHCNCKRCEWCIALEPPKDESDALVSTPPS